MEQEFDIDPNNKFRVILNRIRDNVKKSKKSIESLGGEWWNMVIFQEPTIMMRLLSLTTPLPTLTDEKTDIYLRHR